jgi:hypothetical protein
MGKAVLASPDINNLVQEVAKELGLTQYGIEFVTMKKKSKEVITVKKAGELFEAYVKKEKMLAVLVYEEAFDKVEEKDQWMWVRQALARVSYDLEKDKVSLNAPMLSVPLDFYQKYGNVAMQNAELALLTVQHLQDEEKQRKEEEKTSKKKRR